MRIVNVKVLSQNSTNTPTIYVTTFQISDLQNMMNYHIQHNYVADMMLSADEIDMNHIALRNLYTLHN